MARKISGGACPADASAVVTTVLHELAQSLGNAVDAKDSHTQQHSEEVAEIAHALALRMGLSPVQADIIHVAAHLHDVGKIGVPDAILRKPGPLTQAEWDVVRQHPRIGADIVRPVRQLRDCGVMEMILHHHERFDGSGYPAGLKGRDIPLGARIICLADSVSAMLQDRPYRKGLSIAQVVRAVEDQAGRQFDPHVAQVFIETSKVIEDLLACLGRDPCEPGRDGAGIIELGMAV